MGRPTRRLDRRMCEELLMLITRLAAEQRVKTGNIQLGALIRRVGLSVIAQQAS